MIFQYEMYFTNEYIEEIIGDLSMVMDVCIREEEIKNAMYERNNLSKNNVLLFKKSECFICIDCNNKDWIYPLVVRCQENEADQVKEIMLKWDNQIRDEYAQKQRETMDNVYGKEDTLLSEIEKYYGITV